MSSTPEAAPQRFAAAEFFAGIGLVRTALEQTGIGVTWANDIEQCKQRVYAENFDAEDFVLGDVRDVRGLDLPTVDLATASFPCTDLSLAGNRGGIREGESSMFWQFARVLDEMGDRCPGVILLENVPGFATSKGGRDLHDALHELNRLGYSCDLLMVNASHFVPQSRLRMFIVGALQPDPDDVPAVLVDDLRPQWIADFILRHPDLRLHSRALPLPFTSAAPLADVIERHPRSSPVWWQEARAAAFLSSLAPLQRERLNKLRLGDRLTWRTAYRRTRGGVAMWEIRSDEIAGCLRTARGGSSKQAVVEAGRGRVSIRWMTASEYAALQGAADHKCASVTESQAKFGFGDAVCVPVIAWITRNYILPLLEAHTLALV